MRKLLAIVKQQNINEIIQFRGNFWRALTFFREHHRVDAATETSCHSKS